MKRLVFSFLVTLPLLCCSRVGYEEIFLPDGREEDARDAGSQTDANTWVDAGADQEVDAGGDDADAGADAEDAGVIDASGGDDADGADATDGDAGGDQGEDGEDAGADTGPDAGDQGPWTCRAVESYVDSFSVISTAFVVIEESEISFTPQSPDENWLVMVSAAMVSDYNGAAKVEANYTINDVEKGVGGFRPGDPWMEGSWQHFVLITGTTDTQVVKVGLREGWDGFQATILRLRVIAFPLPPGADVHYLSADDIQPVAPAAWNTHLELMVSPVSPGRYLIMSSVSASEEPGMNSVGVRLVDGQGDFWPEANPVAPDANAYYANNRYPWRSLFVARARNLSSPATYKIEATGSDPGGSRIFYRRILAFRTDALSAFDTVEDLATVSNTTSSAVPVSILSVSPNPQDCPQVAIQSMFVWANQSGAVFPISEYHLDGSPVASYSESLGIGFGFCVPFGVFHLLPGDSTVQLENVFYVSVDGPEGNARESVIHVLGL